LFRGVKYDWQFLRDFFGIAYFRLLVTWFAIVPVLVGMFGGLPDVIRIPSVGDEILTIHLALPFKWWILWWSSFLYVLAASLYVLAGPSFIRRNADYAAYKTHKHSPRWIIWEWRNFLNTAGRPSDVDVIIRKGLAEPSVPSVAPSKPDAIRNISDLYLWEPAKDADETWFLFERKGSIYKLGLGGGQDGHELKEEELFWELYGRQANSRPVLKGFIWAALGLAGLLFLTAVGQNIYAVLNYLYRSWC